MGSIVLRRGEILDPPLRQALRQARRQTPFGAAPELDHIAVREEERARRIHLLKKGQMKAIYMKIWLCAVLIS